MLDLIVLGQIPGTDIHLGFVGYMIIFDLVLIFYIFRKYHPGKLARFSQKLKPKKTIQKLRTYRQRLVKQLFHIRHDILGPKLKFLK